ncbi:MAG: hypothetical protein IVW52_04915 [Acidimicrobiales bacterium]|nr:hypothetical protein [Acidimicrobiales bacterium]
MSRSVEADFRVPDRDAQSDADGWFWRLSAWPGVHEARLGGFSMGRPTAALHVRASARAMRRVRSFCTRRGYEEEGP